MRDLSIIASRFISRRISEIFLAVLLVHSGSAFGNFFKAVSGEIDKGYSGSASPYGLETVQVGNDNRLYVFKSDRMLLSPAFPMSFNDEEIITSPFLYDLNRDGESEIFIGTRRVVGATTNYKLYTITKSGKRVAPQSYLLPDPIGFGSDILLSDVFGSLVPDFILPGNDGVINIRRSDNMQLVGTLSYDPGQLPFIDVTNFAGSPNPQLLVAGTSGRFFVASNNGITFQIIPGLDFTRSGKVFFDSPRFYTVASAPFMAVAAQDGYVEIVDLLAQATAGSFQVALSNGEGIFSKPYLIQPDINQDPSFVFGTSRGRIVVYSKTGTFLKELSDKNTFVTSRFGGIDRANGLTNEFQFRSDAPALELLRLSSTLQVPIHEAWGETKHKMGLKVTDTTKDEDKLFSPSIAQADPFTTLSFQVQKEKDDYSIVYANLLILDEANQVVLMTNFFQPGVEEHTGTLRQFSFLWDGSIQGVGGFVPDGLYTYVFHAETKFQEEVVEVKGKVRAVTTAPVVATVLDNRIMVSPRVTEGVSNIATNVTFTLKVKAKTDTLATAVLEIFELNSFLSYNQVPIKRFVTNSVDLPISVANGFKSNEFSFQWDGLNSFNPSADVTSGIYVYRVTVSDTASNTTSQNGLNNLLFYGTTGNRIDPNFIQVSPFLLKIDENGKSIIRVKLINEFLKYGDSLLDDFKTNAIWEYLNTVRIDFSAQNFSVTNGVPVTNQFPLFGTNFSLVGNNIFSPLTGSQYFSFDRNDLYFEYQWDGKTNSTLNVAPGTYQIMVNVKDSFGQSSSNFTSILASKVSPKISAIEPLGNGYYNIRGVANRLDGFNGFSIGYKTNNGSVTEIPVLPRLADPANAYVSKIPVTGLRNDGLPEGGILATLDIFDMVSNKYCIELNVLGNGATTNEKTLFSASNSLDFGSTLIRDYTNTFDIITPGRGIKTNTFFTFRASKPLLSGRLLFGKNNSISATKIIKDEYRTGNFYIVPFDGTPEEVVLPLNGAYQVSLWENGKTLDATPLTLYILQGTNLDNNSVVLNDFTNSSGFANLEEGYFYSWLANVRGLWKPDVKVDWEVDLFGRQEVLNYPDLPLKIKAGKGYRKIDLSDSTFDISAHFVIRRFKLGVPIIGAFISYCNQPNEDLNQDFSVNLSAKDVTRFDLLKTEKIGLESRVFILGSTNHSDSSMFLYPERPEHVFLIGGSPSFSLRSIVKNGRSYDIAKDFKYSLFNENLSSTSDLLRTLTSTRVDCNGYVGYQVSKNSLLLGLKSGNVNDLTFSQEQTVSIINQKISPSGTTIAFSDLNKESFEKLGNLENFLSEKYSNAFFSSPDVLPSFKNFYADIATYKPGSFLSAPVPSANYSFWTSQNGGKLDDFFLSQNKLGILEGKVSQNYFYADDIPYPIKDSIGLKHFAPYSLPEEFRFDQQENRILASSIVSKFRNGIDGSFAADSILQLSSGPGFPSSLNHIVAYPKIIQAQVLDHDGSLIPGDDLANNPDLFRDVLLDLTPMNTNSSIGDFATNYSARLSALLQRNWESSVVSSGLRFFPVSSNQISDTIVRESQIESNSAIPYSLPHDVEATFVSLNLQNNGVVSSSNVEVQAVAPNGDLVISKSALGQTGVSTKKGLRFSGVSTISGFKYYTAEIDFKAIDDSVTNIRRVVFSDSENQYQVSALGSNGSFDRYIDVSDLPDGRYKLVSYFVGSSDVVEKTQDFRIGTPVIVSNLALYQGTNLVSGAYDPAKEGLAVRFFLNEPSLVRFPDTGVSLEIRQGNSLLRSIVTNGYQGFNEIIWNGRSTNGQLLVTNLVPQNYQVILKIDNQDGLTFPNSYASGLAYSNNITQPFVFNAPVASFLAVTPSEIIPTWSGVGDVGKSKAKVYFNLDKDLETNQIVSLKFLNSIGNVLNRTIVSTGIKGSNSLVWEGLKDDLATHSAYGSYNLQLSILENGVSISTLISNAAVSVVEVDTSISGLLASIDISNQIQNGVIPGKNGSTFRWQSVVRGSASDRVNFSLKVLAHGIENYKSAFTWSASAQSTYQQIDPHNQGYTFIDPGLNSDCAKFNSSKNTISIPGDWLDISAVLRVINYHNTESDAISGNFFQTSYLSVPITLKKGKNYDLIKVKGKVNCGPATIVGYSVFDNGTQLGNIIKYQKAVEMYGEVQVNYSTYSYPTQYASASGFGRYYYTNDGDVNNWVLENGSGQRVNEIGIVWNFPHELYGPLTPSPISIQSADGTPPPLGNISYYSFTTALSPDLGKEWSQPLLTFLGSLSKYDRPDRRRIKLLGTHSTNEDFIFSNYDAYTQFAGGALADVYIHSLEVVEATTNISTKWVVVDGDTVTPLETALHGPYDDRWNKIYLEVIPNNEYFWESSNEIALNPDGKFLGRETALIFPEDRLPNPVQDILGIDIFNQNTNKSGLSYNPQFDTVTKKFIKITSLDVDIQKFNLGQWDTIAQVADSRVLKNNSSIQFVASTNLTPISKDSILPTNANDLETYKNLYLKLNILDERKVLDIMGSAVASTPSDFKEYSLEYGRGASPSEWFPIWSSVNPVSNSLLANWDISGRSGVYSLLLTVRDINSKVQLSKSTFTIGNYIDGDQNFVVYSPFKKASIFFNKNSMKMGDEVYLLNPAKTPVDVVTYGSFENSDVPGSPFTGTTFSQGTLTSNKYVGMSRKVSGEHFGGSIYSEDLTQSFIPFDVLGRTPGTGPATVTAQTGLVINEIYWGKENYAMSGTFEALEKYGQYIELYNPSASPIDISGYTIGDGEGEGIIPQGKVIPAKSYFVVARNANAFYKYFGKYPDLEWDPYQYDGDNNQTVADLEFSTSSKPVVSMELDHRGSEAISIIPSLQTGDLSLNQGEVTVDDFVYDFKPDGLKFAAGYSPTFTYYGDTNELPAGVDPAYIRIAFVNDNNQVEFLNSWTTSYSNRFNVYADLTHFSKYVILGSTGSPSIPVLISAPTLVNKKRIDLVGQAQGNTTLFLEVNGESVTNIPVNADGGFRIAQVSIAEGLNKVTLYSLNRLGQRGQSLVLGVTADTTSPLITAKSENSPAISPNGDGIIDSKRFTIDFNEAVKASILVSIPGGSGTTIFSKNGSDFTASRQEFVVGGSNFKKEGFYPYVIQAYDLVNNALVDSPQSGGQMIVDLHPPVAKNIALSSTNISPNGDGFFDFLSLDFDLTDNLTKPSGQIVIKDSFDFEVNRISFDTNASKQRVIWAGDRFDKITVPDGIYSIVGVFQDSAGNRTNQLLSKVLIDTKAPVGLSNAFLSNQLISQSRPFVLDYDLAETSDFKVQILDANLNSLSSIYGVADQAAGEYVKELPIYLNDGKYVARLILQDKNQNKTIKDLPFSVDNNAPRIQLDEDYAKLNHGFFVTLRGDIQDEYIDTISIYAKKSSQNDSEFKKLTEIKNQSFSNQTIFNWSVLGEAGLNDIRVDVSDLAGNVSSVLVTPVEIKIVDTGDLVAFNSTESKINGNSFSSQIGYTVASNALAKFLLLGNQGEVVTNFGEAVVGAGNFNLGLDFTLPVLTNLNEGNFTLQSEYYPSVSDPRLLAHFPFNGNANNYGAWANGFTSFDVESVVDRQGNPGSALQFNGATSAVEYRTLSTLSNFTLGAWLYLQAEGGHSFISASNTENGTRLQVSLVAGSANGLLVDISRDGGTESFQVPCSIPTGSWIYFTVGFSSNSFSASVNGLEITATNSYFPFADNILSSNSVLRFGRTFEDNNNLYGSVDEVRLYDTYFFGQTSASLYNLENLLNRKIATTSILIDRVKPNVQIFSPENFSNVFESPVSVIGSLSDSNLKEFRVYKILDLTHKTLLTNGIDPVYSNQVLSYPLDFASDKTTLELNAVDTFGNENSAFVTLQTPKAEPVVKFLDKDQNLFFNSNTLVRAYVTSPTGAYELLASNSSFGSDFQYVSSLALTNGVNTVSLNKDLLSGDGQYTFKLRSLYRNASDQMQAALDSQAPAGSIFLENQSGILTVSVSAADPFFKLGRLYVKKNSESDYTMTKEFKTEKVSNLMESYDPLSLSGNLYARLDLYDKAGNFSRTDANFEIKPVKLKITKPSFEILAGANIPVSLSYENASVDSTLKISLTSSSNGQVVLLSNVVVTEDNISNVQLTLETALFPEGRYLIQASIQSPVNPQRDLAKDSVFVTLDHTVQISEILLSENYLTKSFFKNNRVFFNYSVDEAGSLTSEIRTPNGDLVRLIKNNLSVFRGDVKELWDGEDNNHTPVDVGTYYYVARFTDLAGNVFEKAKYFFISPDNQPLDRSAPVTLVTFENGNQFGTFIHPSNHISLIAVDSVTSNDIQATGVASLKFVWLRDGVAFDDSKLLPYTNTLLIPSLGQKWILYFQSSDLFGNVETLRSNAFIGDEIAPQVQLAAVPNLISFQSNLYFIPNTQFGFTSSDATSGVRDIWLSVDGADFEKNSALFGLDSPGTHTLKYYAVDFVNNTTATNEITLSAPPPDITPPVTSLVKAQVYFESNSGTTYLNAATGITFTAVDILGANDGAASGVVYTEYCLDGGALIRWQGESVTFGVGNHTLQYRSVDNSGNTEETKVFTFFADGIAPVTALTSGIPFYSGSSGQVYTSTNNRLFFQSVDDASGLLGILYADSLLNSGFTQSFTNLFTITEGSNQLAYFSLDNVSNTEVVFVTNIFADGTAPVTIARLNDGSVTLPPISNFALVGAGYNLVLSTIDPLCKNVSSGVGSTEYRINGGTWIQYSSPIALNDLAEGTNQVSFRSIDHVQNVETSKVIYLFKDIAPPLVSINSPAEGDIVSFKVPVFATVSDVSLVSYSLWVKSSGTTNLTLITNGFSNISGFVGFWNVSGLSNGTYSLILKAQDFAGQFSSTQVNLDIGNAQPILTYGNHKSRDSKWDDRYSDIQWNKIKDLLEDWGDKRGMKDFVPADKLKLSNPAGLNADNDDFVYLTDPNSHTVRVLDGLGNQIYTFDDVLSSKDIDFKSPVDISFTRSGDYYVLDKEANYLHRFQFDGVYLYSLGGGTKKVFSQTNWKTQSFSASTNKGCFNAAESVDIDNDGNVYVADTQNNRVQIFSDSGAFVRIISGLSKPRGVYVVKQDFIQTYGSNETLLVADSGSSVVKEFSLAGVLLGTFNGVSGAGSLVGNIRTDKNLAFNNTVKVGMDYLNRLVVLDEKKTGDDTFSRVLKFDRYLNLQLAFTNISTYTNKGKTLPYEEGSGIAFDKSRGYFYLSDTVNKKVEKLKLTTRDFDDRTVPVADIRMSVEKNKNKSCQFNRRASDTLQIFGEAADAYFNEALISYGAGNNPSSFIVIDRLSISVWKGLLATWNVKNIPEGVYTLKLDVYDLAGNHSSDKMTVEITSDKIDVAVDPTNNEPVAYLNLPPYAPSNVSLEKVFYRSSDAISLTWQFADPNLGDQQDGFVVKVDKVGGSGRLFDNRATTIRYNQYFTFSGSQLSGDGEYSLSVQTFDNSKAGSIFSTGKRLVIDSISPVVSITGVNDGASYVSSVTPFVSVSDAYLKTCQITLDGQAFVSGTSVTADGSHQLIVTAQDQAGNTTSRSISFNINSQVAQNTNIYNPQIFVAGVQNGLYSSANLHVEVFFQDVFADKSVILNGVPVGTATTTSSGTTVSFDVTTEGIFYLVAQGLDLNGITRTVSMTFKVDKTAPIVAISGATDGGFYNSVTPSVAVSGEAPGEFTTTAKLDGSDFSLGSSVTTEGSHILSVTIVDKAGNSAQKSVSFTIDTISPVITVTGVSSGSYYNNNVVVNVQVTEANLLNSTISLNGTPVNLPATISVEGKYTLRIAASDKAGNSAIRMVDFGVDKTLPIVFISGIQNNGKYIKADLGVKIYEQNLDNANSSLKLDTTELKGSLVTNLDQNSQLYSGVQVTNFTNVGVHSFVYNVKDLANNSVNGQVNFEILAFDVKNSLTAWATYDKDTKLNFALGDSNEYSSAKAVYVGGYHSNCDQLGVNASDTVTIYKSLSNISDSKGTLSIWLKPSWTQAGNGNRTIFALKNSDTADESVFSLKAHVTGVDGTVFSIKDKNNSLVTIYVDKTKVESSRWYSASAWTYLTFTWDYATGKAVVYVNGDKVGEGVITGNPKADSKYFLIGAAKDTGTLSQSASFAGKLDEMRVYSKALSDVEVKFLFELEK